MATTNNSLNNHAYHNMNIPGGNNVTPDKKNLDLSPVVDGGNSIKKKSVMRKIIELFLPVGIDDIPRYIAREIMVPAAKRQLHDITDIFLGPSTGPYTNRSSGLISNGINYQNSSLARNSRPVAPASNGSNTDAYGLNSITFNGPAYANNPDKAQADAQKLLVRLQDILDDYKILTANEFLSLGGISPIPHTATHYGWYSIANAQVLYLDGYWNLILPKAVPLNN